MSSQAIYFKRANFTASHVFLWLVGAPLLLDGMFSNVAVWNSLGVGISQILLRIIGGIKQFYGGRGRSCFMPFARYILFIIKKKHMTDVAKALDHVDVIIVGGGPAGLNAALVLGRCRRNVLLFDEGKPRNAVSHALHGFLSRDGIDPSDLREIAIMQLAVYPSVQVDEDRVVDAIRTDHGFLVTTRTGRRVWGRKLLLAAGVVDDLPKQPGFSELYGIGLFHCPYCDGWEMRDRPLAAYGRGDNKGGGLALEMTLWSRDTVLCTDGPSELSDHYRRRLEINGVAIREEKIVRLEIHHSVPYNAEFDIVFETGARLRRAAIFFNTGRIQSTDLAARLGCDMYEPNGCKVDNDQQMTHVPGLYVAGDASRDVLQVIVAAAEGVEAAIGINNALLREDLL